MDRKILALDPDGTCIVDTQWNEPRSRCFFDFWSIPHLIYTALLYEILLQIFPNKQIILLVIVNLLHILEEILGNTVWWNFEGILANYVFPIIEPRYKQWSYVTDHDTL